MWLLSCFSTELYEADLLKKRQRTESNVLSGGTSDLSFLTSSSSSSDLTPRSDDVTRERPLDLDRFVNEFLEKNMGECF